MKNLAEGYRSVLSTVRRQPDLIESTIINLYKSFMGRNAARLPAVRFHQGTLFLTAINQSWKKEGKSQEAAVIKVLNNMLHKEVIKNIRWVAWPDKLKKKEETSNKLEEKPKELPPEYELILKDVKNDKARKAFRSYLNNLPLKNSTEK